MPGFFIPLLFTVGALTLAPAVVSGFRRAFGTSASDRPAGPPGSAITPAEERSREIALLERQFVFQVGESELARREAAKLREIARQDRADDIRRAEAARGAEVRRLVEVENRRFAQQLEALREQARLDAQVRARAEVLRREEINLQAAIKQQSVRANEFASFARALPPGTTAAISPDGTFTSIPVGSALTPADVARGAVPLPFSIPTTTRGRITTTPGVFVGPGFRFNTIEQATAFLVSGRVKGQQVPSRERVAGFSFSFG